MKCLIILLITGIQFSCNRENRKPYSVSKNRPIFKLVIPTDSKSIVLKNNTIYFDNKKYDGALYQLYKNKNDTESVVYFSNGIMNGVSKKWYSNKQLMELRYYSNGEKNGPQISFFDNGNKKFEFIAQNDKYEGILKEWNREGQLVHLATFRNGQEEGPQKMWYDNGKIRANYVMLNGKRYGLLGTKNCKNVSDSIFVVK